jgi:hypothetical protein
MGGGWSAAAGEAGAVGCRGSAAGKFAAAAGVLAETAVGNFMEGGGSNISGGVGGEYVVVGA